MRPLPSYNGEPVIIIGNGPVGATVALLLARWGMPVMVLDGRLERDLRGSKAICQQRDVLDVWEAVGVGRQLANEGVTWSTARTYYKDQELFSRTLAAAGQAGFPPFVNLSQSRTEQVLAAQMAATPLIEQRWGHTVTTIRQDALGVTLTCRTVDGTCGGSSVWGSPARATTTGSSSATSRSISRSGRASVASTSIRRGTPAGRC